MTKRVLSLWLPRLATDRIARAQPDTRGKPLAAALQAHNRRILVAVNDAAEGAGAAPGRTVSDARALCPDLAVVEADPAGDLRALARLADWCSRYTPWAAVDRSGGFGVHDINVAGLRLDITGCAHLFGGEVGLLAELVGRLESFGLCARMAIADTPGAAWAWARFGSVGERPILATGSQTDRLAPLPVTALRLPPADADTLMRLGVKRIGDLYPIPRAALAARFGEGVRRRLDQALGNSAEPISPRRQVAPIETRLAFAEPINRAEDIAAGLSRLLPTLCARLEAEGLGARRLRFTLYRIDGTTGQAVIGTSRPSRSARHLARLFTPRLEDLDPDPGVELLILAAPATQKLALSQVNQASSPHDAPLSHTHTTIPDQDSAQLIDRLANRLGRNAVLRLAPRESPLPEHRNQFVSALEDPPDGWPDWCDRRLTPLRLFARPEPAETSSMAAPMIGGQETGGQETAKRVNREAPPAVFTWRGRTHHVARADGPEHLMGPWWNEDVTAKASRAYFRVEDEAGRRLWLFHDRHNAHWYVHGLFG